MIELLRLCRLRAHGVRVSRSARVAAGVRVERRRGASVILHPGAVLGEGARISALGGRVVVGPGARLGERAIVVSRVGVVIGERAVVGDWAAVSAVEPESSIAPLVIGDRAVLGPHSVVGASVAAGSVVAPYAVV